MNATVIIEFGIVEGTEILVFAPYNAKFIADAKKNGGKWHAEEKAWQFAASNEETLRSLIEKHYNEAEVVEARPMSDAEARDAATQYFAAHCATHIEDRKEAKEKNPRDPSTHRQIGKTALALAKWFEKCFAVVETKEQLIQVLSIISPCVAETIKTDEDASRVKMYARMEISSLANRIKKDLVANKLL